MPGGTRTPYLRLSFQHHISMTALAGLLAGLYLDHFRSDTSSLYGTRCHGFLGVVFPLQGSDIHRYGVLHCIRLLVRYCATANPTFQMQAPSHIKGRCSIQMSYGHVC